MNTVYDRQVLTAASGWRYKPATLDGTPVKYRKFIQIALSPKSYHGGRRGARCRHDSVCRIPLSCWEARS